MGIVYLSGSEGQVFMCGLSTDTKPSEPQVGWVFREIDTDKFFWSVNTSWVNVQNNIYSSSGSYFIVGSTQVALQNSKISCL